MYGKIKRGAPHIPQCPSFLDRQSFPQNRGSRIQKNVISGKDVLRLCFFCPLHMLPITSNISPMTKEKPPWLARASVKNLSLCCLATRQAQKALPDVGDKARKMVRKTRKFSNSQKCQKAFFVGGCFVFALPF